MNELIKILLGWKEAAGKVARPLPKKPKAPAKGPGKPRYPAGATEAEKLRIAQRRIKAAREAARGPGRRDIGGPFGQLPSKIGAGVKRVAGEKPKEGAKKPWYKLGLRDLF